jgi:hypothetical protein
LLAGGDSVERTGGFGALVEASRRLAFIVPVTSVLDSQAAPAPFNSVHDSSLGYRASPFAVSDGVLGRETANLNFGIWRRSAACSM